MIANMFQSLFLLNYLTINRLRGAECLGTDSGPQARIGKDIASI